MGRGLWAAAARRSVRVFLLGPSDHTAAIAEERLRAMHPGLDLVGVVVLATVTAWCAQIDVLATDMRVEQRSLEDVFLELTGKQLR